MIPEDWLVDGTQPSGAIGLYTLNEDDYTENIEAIANAFRENAGPVTGSCEDETGGKMEVNNNTVARIPSHPFLDCGDQIYINSEDTSARGVKTVTDNISEETGIERQLDHYTGINACEEDISHLDEEAVVIEIILEE